MEEITEQTNTKLKNLQRVTISVNWLIIIFISMESGLILYNNARATSINNGLLKNNAFAITIAILIFVFFFLILGFCIPIYSKKRVYNDSILMEIPDKKLAGLRIASEAVMFFVIASAIFYNSKVFLATEVFAILFLFSIQLLIFSKKRFKYMSLLFIAIILSMEVLIFWKTFLNPNTLSFTFWILSIVLIEFIDAVSCIVIKKNI